MGALLKEPFDLAEFAIASPPTWIPHWFGEQIAEHYRNANNRPACSGHHTPTRAAETGRIRDRLHELAAYAACAAPLSGDEEVAAGVRRNYEQLTGKIMVHLLNG